ncbi:MAG: APC family permease [Candidatus Rokubacteria bacterium]|nr:APC family permease [Candidatus Rokubacteria bacterium]
MRLYTLKKLLVGSPIPTAQARHERLGKATGLAVFASDNLSSVAYATEEILRVLILAGSAALAFSVPIGLVIAAVILIVINSYSQSILAYPQGASDYIIAKENLGTAAGLTAGAALLIDYTLTVAVSVSAGVAAVTSAVPLLYPYRVVLGVVLVVAIGLANLRGVRESGRLFAVPTYLFIGGFFLLLGVGLARYVAGGVPPAPAAGPPAVASGVGLFLLLRAFSSGAVALTGIEAVADGVTAFKPPEARNARIVLLWLGAIMATLFAGVTFLASAFGIAPKDEETVVSQLAWQIFGGGALYFYVQAVSMIILVLAANTAFADFPRLAFFMARDGFLPRQFGNRGDRLVFSNGVVILGLAAAALIVIFEGSTHALIPLYAVGVFTSFTLHQTGMVRRWLRRRPAGWWWRSMMNGAGAITTGVVALVVLTTKFMDGAWIVAMLVGVFIVQFLTIKRHYRVVAEQLSLERLQEEPALTHTVLVLVGDLHAGVVRALRYAQSLSPTSKAVYVETDPDKTRKLEEKWTKWGCGVPLVVLTSPYRSLLGPFLEYLDHIQSQGENHMVTIVLPEFIPARWWQHLLHNQTALLIKGALLFRRNVIVTDVPYHLAH